MLYIYNIHIYVLHVSIVYTYTWYLRIYPYVCVKFVTVYAMISKQIFTIIIFILDKKHKPCINIPNYLYTFYLHTTILEDSLPYYLLKTSQKGNLEHKHTFTRVYMSTYIIIIVKHMRIRRSDIQHQRCLFGWLRSKWKRRRDRRDVPKFKFQNLTENLKFSVNIYRAINLSG